MAALRVESAPPANHASPSTQNQPLRRVNLSSVPCWVAQDVLPALRKLHILRSWGAINVDIDGAPLLGEHPSAPGFFYAVTSNGYTLGPAVGRTTAELITKGRAERDISQFGVERFRGLARTR
jgi:glycine/D-amino acid oxidase-like deaminating enzyme